VVLFDLGASHSFVSSTFASEHKLNVITIAKGGYCISVAGNNIMTNQVVKPNVLVLLGTISLYNFAI
jgi:predicted RNA methylase